LQENFSAYISNAALKCQTITREVLIVEIKTIGETAGLVWNFLRSNGESSLSALEKGVKAPRSTVSMAVGWLAREGKIEVKDEKRTVRIFLRDA
jgi:Winged helix-turn-helix domain (DUF2582)